MSGDGDDTVPGTAYEYGYVFVVHGERAVNVKSYVSCASRYGTTRTTRAADKTPPTVRGGGNRRLDGPRTIFTITNNESSSVVMAAPAGRTAPTVASRRGRARAPARPRSNGR